MKENLQENARQNRTQQNTIGYNTKKLKDNELKFRGHIVLVRISWGSLQWVNGISFTDLISVYVSVQSDCFSINLLEVKCFVNVHFSETSKTQRSVRHLVNNHTLLG